jgi:hypothetical protein
MPLPSLRPRVEQAVYPPIDQSGEVRALGPVTVRTRQAQIILVVRPTVLLGDDVFDVKSEKVRIVLMDPAVLAPAAGAAPDEIMKGGVHYPFVAANR